MNTRSVHFPERAEARVNGPITENTPAVQKAVARRQIFNKPIASGQPNVITALGTTTREAALIVEKLKPIVHSESRHGDLLVARGAAQRLIQALDVLIAHEEHAGEADITK